MLLDGEGFILQEQRGFTRIRSGTRWWLLAAARLDLRSTLRWQCALAMDSRRDLLQMTASVCCEKP
jgi:hypothetical protein